MPHQPGRPRVNPWSTSIFDELLTYTSSIPIDYAQVAQPPKPQGPPLMGSRAPHDAKPAKVSVWYMHSNHTFTRLEGALDVILAKSQELAAKSPHGMLCKVIVLDDKDREIERVGVNVHAGPTGFTKQDLNKWFAALPDRALDLIWDVTP